MQPISEISPIRTKRSLYTRSKFIIALYLVLLSRYVRISYAFVAVAALHSNLTIALSSSSKVSKLSGNLICTGPVGYSRLGSRNTGHRAYKKSGATCVCYQSLMETISAGFLSETYFVDVSHV